MGDDSSWELRTQLLEAWVEVERSFPQAAVAGNFPGKLPARLERRNRYRLELSHLNVQESYGGFQT